MTAELPIHSWKADRFSTLAVRLQTFSLHPDVKPPIGTTGFSQPNWDGAILVKRAPSLLPVSDFFPLAIAALGRDHQMTSSVGFNLSDEALMQTARPRRLQWPLGNC
jgi:hypothetical protein